MAIDSGLGRRSDMSRGWFAGGSSPAITYVVSAFRRTVTVRLLAPRTPAGKPDTTYGKDYARAAVFALAAFEAAAFSTFFADLTAIFAAPLACSASVANAAGLEIASSDRLFRSSVTPAFFKPLIS